MIAVLRFPEPRLSEPDAELKTKLLSAERSSVVPESREEEPLLPIVAEPSCTNVPHHQTTKYAKKKTICPREKSGSVVPESREEEPLLPIVAEPSCTNVPP